MEPETIPSQRELLTERREKSNVSTIRSQKNGTTLFCIINTGLQMPKPHNIKLWNSYKNMGFIYTIYLSDKDLKEYTQVSTNCLRSSIMKKFRLKSKYWQIKEIVRDTHPFSVIDTTA